MNMTRQSSESTRYMLQVGRNRFRRDTWETMKDICAVENTRLADEIWCALDAHVKEYAATKQNTNAPYVGQRPSAGPSPDFSLPENNNIFDKMVDKMVEESAEEEVEEVIDEERTRKPRMAGSDMFGHYSNQK